MKAQNEIKKVTDYDKIRERLHWYIDSKARVTINRFAAIAANDLDISEVQIGRCLGHSWSKTVTARYIADDRSKVDMVVRRVAEYVNG